MTKLTINYAENPNDVRKIVGTVTVDGKKIETDIEELKPLLTDALLGVEGEKGTPAEMVADHIERTSSWRYTVVKTEEV